KRTKGARRSRAPPSRDFQVSTNSSPFGSAAEGRPPETRLVVDLEPAQRRERDGRGPDVVAAPPDGGEHLDAAEPGPFERAPVAAGQVRRQWLAAGEELLRPHALLPELPPHALVDAPLPKLFERDAGLLQVGLRDEEPVACEVGRQHGQAADEEE